MKPIAEYFSVNLSQRPARASKRGALTRAFEMAAQSVIDRAIDEGVPDDVVIMVTLARKPTPEEIAAATAQPAACGCPTALPPCEAPKESRLMPGLCVPCGHAMTCHTGATT